ncbi:MAG: tRNA threonylcarbamoyladenosine dehydratase [Methylophilaceae bacterium]
MNENHNMERRFSGVRRLYGEQGLAQLHAAHVVVIGIGGVGSWAAEALARNAVGELTLIDLDNIAESNVNRQIHAVDGNFGKAKVTAMCERILTINPTCIVRKIEDFVTTDNIDIILDFNCDVMLDCTDSTYAKMALASYCQSKQIPLMMSGSAGGRVDPTRIKIADLSVAFGDQLLSKVRKQLRQSHDFPKAPDMKKRPLKKPKKFGVQCVYSDELAATPEAACGSNERSSHTGLHCAGFGSNVTITASMGFAIAQLALSNLVA